MQSLTLWQQTTIEITRLSLSPLASTINCLLASQAMIGVSHQDHNIGITLVSGMKFLKGGNAVATSWLVLR